MQRLVIRTENILRELCGKFVFRRSYYKFLSSSVLWFTVVILLGSWVVNGEISCSSKGSTELLAKQIQPICFFRIKYKRYIPFP